MTYESVWIKCGACLRRSQTYQGRPGQTIYIVYRCECGRDITESVTLPCAN
jgi:hypothetical protein